MKNRFKSLRGGRLGLVATICLTFTAQPAHAQQTVTYTDGENRTTAIDTSAPNDPSTLTISAGSAEQSGVISGTGSVIKTGDGSLTLSAGNTYSGSTSIRFGTLNLDGAAARIDHATSDFIVGTTTGDNATANIQGGADAIVGDTLIGNGSTGKLTVTGSGSTLNVSGDILRIGNSSSGIGTLEILDGGTVTAGKFMDIGSGANSTGTVLVDGAGSTLTAVTSLNVGFTGDGMLTVQNGGLVDRGVQDVVIALAPGTTGTVNLNSGGTVRATDIRVGRGNGTINFDGGRFQATQSRTFFSNVEPGDIQLLGGGGIIDSQGFDVGTGAVFEGAGGLTKEGNGTLTLSGASNHAGGTTLSEGTLVIGNDSALGTGTFTIGDGTTISQKAGNKNIANDIVIDGNFTRTASPADSLNFLGDVDLGTEIREITVTSGSNMSFFGSIGGAGGVTFVDTNNIVPYRGSTANTYTGLTTVQDGASLALAKDTDVTAIAGDLTIDAGGFVSTSSRNQIANSSAVTLNGRLSLGSSETIGDLQGSGTVEGTFALSGVRLGIQSGNFDGVIQGNISIRKTTAGSLTLSGNNNYSRGTEVNGGTLLADNTTGSATGFGAVQVMDDATLGGGGFITGNVTIDDGGRLAPGIGAGTLTTGGLTLNDNSQLDYELDTPGVVGSGVNDLVVVNGDLVLDGVLNITDLGSFGVGDYRLFDFTGGLTDNDLLFGTVPGGFDLTVDTGTANQVNLSVSAANAQYFDGPNTTANGTVDGGTGIWDDSTTNWTNEAGNANSAWAGGLAAVFSGTPGTVTISNAFSADPTALDFQVGGYTVVAAGTGEISLTNPTDITTATGTTEISAPVTGIGGINKLGDGLLELSGTNTYTGGTILSEGGIIIGNNSALGTGTLTIGDGTSLEGDGPRRITNDMVVNGDFSVAPRNTFPTFSALELDGDVDLGNMTRTITNTLDLSNSEFGQVNFGGVISGDPGTGLTLSDNGFAPGENVVFFRFDGAGANTYDGFTTVGTNVSLVLGKNAGVTAIAGDAQVNNEAVIAIVNSEQIADSSTVTLNGNGRLQIGVGSIAAETETIATLNDDGSGNGSVELSGDGTTGSTLVVSDGNFAGEITGGGADTTSLVKTGAGTLTLSGTNTYLGATLVNGGTLSTESDQNLGEGSLILSDGSLLVTGATTIDNTVTLQAGTFGLVSNDNEVTLSGVISGAGDFIKSGSSVLTLSNTNTYTGNTDVQGGNLTIGDTGSIASSSGVDVDGGATLTLSAGNGDQLGDGILLNLNNDNGAGSFLNMGGTETVMTLTDNGTGGSVIGGIGTLTADTINLSNTTTLIDAALVSNGAINSSGLTTLNGNTTSATFNVNDGAVTLGGGNTTTTLTDDLNIASTASFHASAGILTANTIDLLGTPGSPDALIFLDGNDTYNLLRGNGRINQTGATFTNNAVLAPGDTNGVSAIGQIITGGDYVENGNLVIDFDPLASTADNVRVGSSATTLTANSVLNPFDISGGNVMGIGQRINIIDNGAGGLPGGPVIGGGFGEITDGDNTGPGGSTDPNQIFFDCGTGNIVGLGLINNQGPEEYGGTANQTALITALTATATDAAGNYNSADGGAGTTLDLLYGGPAPGGPITATQLLAGLDGLSPVGYAGVLDYTLQATRNTVRNATHTGAPDSTVRVPVGYSAKESAKEPLAPAPSGMGWDVFAGYSYLDVSSDSNIAGEDYRLQSSGGYVGVRMSPSASLQLGAFFAVDDGSVDATGLNLDVDGILFGLFGRYDHGKFYTSASASFAQYDIDGKRSALGGQVNVPDHDADAYQIGIETGYIVYETESFRITPKIGLQYISADVDGFTESGGPGALSVRSQDDESILLDVGVDFTYSPQMQPWGLEGEIGWEHDFNDSSRPVSASFGGGGAAFTVLSPGMGEDAFYFGLRGHYDLTESLRFSAGYRGELRDDSDILHSVDARITFSF